MRKDHFEESIRNHIPKVTDGIEDGIIGGYGVKFFIENGKTVGGMVLLEDDEVCMVTLESTITGELPDSFECMC